MTISAPHCAKSFGMLSCPKPTDALSAMVSPSRCFHRKDDVPQGAFVRPEPERGVEVKALIAGSRGQPSETSEC